MKGIPLVFAGVDSDGNFIFDRPTPTINQPIQISPKTSFELQGEESLNGSRQHIVDGIILNVKELVAASDWTDWEVIERAIQTNNQNHNVLRIGQPLIRQTLAHSLLVMHAQLGYEMHDPPVVYMCGHFFRWNVWETYQQKTGIYFRKNDFLNEELRQQTMSGRLWERQILDGFLFHLEMALNQYVYQNPELHDWRHRFVLQILTLPLRAHNSPTKRSPIYQALIGEDVDRALQLALAKVSLNNKTLRDDDAFL